MECTRVIIRKIIYMTLTNNYPDEHNDIDLPDFVYKIEDFFYNFSKNFFRDIHCKKVYIDLFYNELPKLRNGTFSSIDTEKNMLFNSTIFKDYKDLEIEADNFQENPVEVQEGVFTCKCGSTKTVHFQTQSRSADEAATNYIQCIKCNKRWTD
jgi:DNA-directed RNA polymerase subunit M/transcription elongation factor TFIIS